MWRKEARDRSVYDMMRAMMMANSGKMSAHVLSAGEGISLSKAVDISWKQAKAIDAHG